jgi:hypothetical protein
MVLVGGFLLIALCLTFGRAQNSGRWSNLSEIACNLSNNLARNPGWSPQQHLSPHSTKIPTEPLLKPSTVPLAAAHPLLVTLPINNAPKYEVYINDLFKCYLYHDLHGGHKILPFLLQLLGRPPDAADPIEGYDILSISKFLAKATPSKLKTILG